MNASFLDHIEELKIFLDSVSNPDAMKSRIDSIEAKMALKQGEEGYLTRTAVMAEASFMIKNKDRIAKALGPERYLGVFSLLMDFLEKNPPEKKKKKKVKPITEETNLDIFANSLFAMPSYNISPTYNGWYIHTDTTASTTGYTVVPTQQEPIERPILPAEHTAVDAAQTVPTVQPGNGALQNGLDELIRSLQAGSYEDVPSRLQEGAALRVENLDVPIRDINDENGN